MSLSEPQYVLFGFAAVAVLCGFILGVRSQTAAAITFTIMFTLLAVVSAVGPEAIENLVVNKDGFTLSLRTQPEEAIQLEGAPDETQEAVKDRILTIPEKYRTDADYLALATVAARKLNHIDTLKFGFSGLNQPSSDNRVKAKLMVRVATALGQIDSLEEALQMFDEALAIEPTLNWAPYNKGVILRYKGRKEDAIAALRKAIEIDPHDQYALRRLEELLRISGPKDEYEKVREQLSKLQPRK